MTSNFFSLLSFVVVFGSGIRDPGSEIRDPGSEIRDPRSGIRDPGSEIRDPGSGINIPDPQHCLFVKILVNFLAPGSGSAFTIRIQEKVNLMRTRIHCISGNLCSFSKFLLCSVSAALKYVCRSTGSHFHFNSRSRWTSRLVLKLAN
jgi:hypothetical protein